VYTQAALHQFYKYLLNDIQHQESLYYTSYRKKIEKYQRLEWIKDIKIKYPFIIAGANSATAWRHVALNIEFGGRKLHKSSSDFSMVWL